MQGILSLSEKHEFLKILWRQHTDEMQLLEASMFNICGRECTIEFQPSADMSWQSWACNELNQAATHPSLMLMCTRIICVSWVVQYV